MSLYRLALTVKSLDTTIHSALVLVRILQSLLEVLHVAKEEKDEIQ